MYSFGRLNPYNPFIGGFVIENVNKGTFKRFKKTKTVIYKYTVTDEQYEKLKLDIRYFLKNHRKFKFNISYSLIICSPCISFSINCELDLFILQYFSINSLQ